MHLHPLYHHLQPQAQPNRSSKPNPDLTPTSARSHTCPNPGLLLNWNLISYFNPGPDLHSNLVPASPAALPPAQPSHWPSLHFSSSAGPSMSMKYEKFQHSESEKKIQEELITGKRRGVTASAKIPS